MTLKFHSVNIESPFQTQDVIMPMFVLSILVYAITLCSTSYLPETISHINILFESLSSVLLSLIIFPTVGRFVFLVWVIYFVKLIYDGYRKLHQLYQQISSVSNLFNQLLAHPSHHDEETIPFFTSRDMQLIVVFLALLPLKFHSMNMAAPFETHGAVMSTFFIATLVYILACVIEAKLEIGNNSYHHISSPKSVSFPQVLPPFYLYWSLFRLFGGSFFWFGLSTFSS
ncbi:hypothetical protein DITRI_Ditri14bG0053600 [Diplodiscus trichospermus]